MIERDESKMNKKTVLTIIVPGVIVCAFVVCVIIFISTHKQANSSEIAGVQQITTTQQETPAGKTQVKKKNKNIKNKKSLFPQKYKKLKVVKINDESETAASSDDNLDEIAEIYKEKSLSSGEAGVALEGCVVKVQSHDKNWTAIKSGKVEGYIESRYIVKGKKAKQVLLATEHILAKIKKQNINIKNDKNKKSSVIGIAYARTTYPIIEISKDEKWVKIKRTETLSGWIPASDMKLKLDKEYVYTSDAYDEMVEAEWKAGAVSYKLESGSLPKNGEARKLIQYASKFLGNRYVWGGTSLTNGADCSGFVQSVFKHFGYRLNRTAAEQSRNGQAVSNNKLKPGDLLFYHTDRRQKNRISHVAIYIGNGKIIHAANRRVGIIISSMGNPCTARRILTGKNNKQKDKEDKQKNPKDKNKSQENKKVKETEKVQELVTETARIIETTNPTENEQETTKVMQETTEAEITKEAS